MKYIKYNKGPLMHNKQHMKELLNRLTLIGSRAWGGSNDMSDYDLLAPAKIEEQIFDILYELKINFEIGGSGADRRLHNYHDVKFIFDKKVINIIFYKDEDYPKIEVVANMMKSLSRTKHFDKAIKVKSRRYRLFESLVDTVFERNMLDDSIINDIGTPLRAMTAGPID